MAEAPRSSFIPKQSSGAVPSSIRRKRRFHVFSFLTSFLLIGSLALAGGAYFYRDYAQKQLDGEKQKLADEKKRFSENDLAAVQTFDRQLHAAQFLLDNHLAPSKLFDALELSTLERIQFTNFSFSEQPSQDVTITLSGGTEEFKTVALQELALNDSPVLKSIAFTQIGTTGATLDQIQNGTQKNEQQDNTHRISFGITGEIDPSLLTYDAKAIAPQPQGDTGGASAPSGNSAASTPSDTGSTDTSSSPQGGNTTNGGSNNADNSSS